MSKNKYKQTTQYKNRKIQNPKYKDQNENSIFTTIQSQLQRGSLKAEKAIENITASEAGCNGL